MPIARTTTLAGTLAAGLLLCLPFTASANHGVEALGALYAFLVIMGLAVILPALVGFFMAIANVSRKRRGLRIASIACTLPLLLAALFFLVKLPKLGGFLMLGVLLNGSLIFSSIRRA